MTIIKHTHGNKITTLDIKLHALEHKFIQTVTLTLHTYVIKITTLTIILQP